MTLFLLLLLMSLVLFALFLGGSLVAQGYLYQAPAEHLPVRALTAALLVGSFMTLWVWIDKRNPRRYDTFFEFAPYDRKEFSEFDAIRWLSMDGTKLLTDPSGNLVEQAVSYRRGTGTKSDRFFETQSEAPFQLQSVTPTGESYMTAAIRLRPDPGSEPIRLDAQFQEDKRTHAKTYLEDKRFVEVGGSRFVQAYQLGVLYVPSTGTVVLALLLNLMLFAIWFTAFWPILQFTRGHAFVLTTLFGLVSMLFVMPMLFKPNRAIATGEANKIAKRVNDRNSLTNDFFEASRV